MSGFLLLPDVLCLDILLRWCDEKSIRKFDSAVCNRNLRNGVLKQLYCSPYFIMEGFSLIDLEAKICKSTVIPFDEAKILNLKRYYDWIAARKIKLNILDVCHSNNTFVALSVDTYQVKKVLVRGDFHLVSSQEVILNLINKCPKLEEVHFHYSLCSSVEKGLEFYKLMSFFTHIQYQYSSKHIPLDIVVIADVCTKLRQFWWYTDGTNDRPKYTCFVGLLEKIIQNNKQLTSLRLENTMQFSAFLFESLSFCHDLQELSITLKDIAPLPLLGKLINTAKNLQYVSFNFSNTLHHSSGILSIYENLKGHKSIKLNNIPGVVDRNDTNIAEFFAIVHGFDHIIFSRIYGIPNNVFDNIAIYNPNLKSLSSRTDGSRFTVNTMKKLLTNCTQLHTLKLEFTDDCITNTGIIDLFSVPNVLKVLVIGAEHLYEQLTTDTVIKIISLCPYVQSFTVSSSSKISQKAIIKYLKGNNRAMKELTIATEDKTTTTAVNIGQKCGVM